MGLAETGRIDDRGNKGSARRSHGQSIRARREGSLTCLDIIDTSLTSPLQKKKEKAIKKREEHYKLIQEQLNVERAERAKLEQARLEEQKAVEVS